MTEEYDLIVVGCGPAGASAALAGVSGGLKVLVLEKNRVVGKPVRCGEYVPSLIMKDIPRIQGFVIQPITGLEVTLPSGEVMTASSPGIMIQRDMFDATLAEAAIESGAEIVTSAEVTGIDDHFVHASIVGRAIKRRAKVIIGADGPRSLVSGAMGNGYSRFAMGIQERLHLADNLKRAYIYYDHRYAGGYAWLFPRGTTANVGLALDLEHSKKLPPLFNDFKSRLLREGIVSSGKHVHKTSGLIPAGGIGDNIQSGNLMLAGDAAGTPNPMTGAGIAPAVISGKLAGELAAEAVTSGDINVLNDYKEESLTTFPFERVTEIKRKIDSYWGTPQGDAIIAGYWCGYT